MSNLIHEKLEWLKQNDPQFRNLYTGPQSQEIPVLGRHRNEDDLYDEIRQNHLCRHFQVDSVRINLLREFPESNLLVYVSGGQYYRTTHGQPHFTVYLDSDKKEHLHIKIPDIQTQVTDLEIMGSFDGKEWENRMNIKKELLNWLQEYSTEYPTKSNHQTIIIKWNKLNRGNKAALQMEYIKI